MLNWFVPNCSALFRLSEDDTFYATVIKVAREKNNVKNRSYKLHPVAFAYNSLMTSINIFLLYES